MLIGFFGPPGIKFKQKKVHNLSDQEYFAKRKLSIQTWMAEIQQVVLNNTEFACQENDW